MSTNTYEIFASILQNRMQADNGTIWDDGYSSALKDVAADLAKSKESSLYNGWTNWETWNVNLWCDNEYPIYQAKNAYVATPWTAENTKDFVLLHFPNGTPDFSGDRAAWYEERGAVNWQEIAEHWEADRLENLP